MDDNYDVVEMDFPPYEEEYSRLPEPESTAEPFYKVKEEVYRRNRAIAAEEQTALLKAEERRKAEKRERYKEMLEEAKPVKPVKRRGLSGKEKLIPWIIVVVGIVSSLHWADNSKPVPDLDAGGGYVTSAQPVQVLQATTVERVTRAAEAEENAFDEFKFGIVREPFENDGVSYIYCTSAMSYRFTPSYDEQIPGMVKIDVSVKNLTDFPYMVMSEFYYGMKGKKTLGFEIGDYDPNNAFSSGGADSAPEAFAFDENHICSFSIDYPLDQFGYDDEVYLYSTPKNVSEQFVQYADEDFEISIKRIMAILETEAVTTVEQVAETEKIPDEVLKVTAVREPFKEDGNSYVYNTAVMSYRFTVESNGLNENGFEKFTINISVKNLTDYGYIVNPYFRAFSLTDSSSGNYQNLDLAYYNKELTHFSSSYKTNYDDEWHEGSPIAFDFDENNLCEFGLIVFLNPESDTNYDTFKYDSQQGFPNHTQNADVGFEIPLEKIWKYLT